MIPYLLILLLVSTTPDGALGAGVDWEECVAADARCFVTAKCKNPQKSDTVLSNFDPSSDDQVRCETAVSIKPYNEKFWIVRLQVAISTTDMVPEKGIQVYSGSKLIVGCINPGPTLQSGPEFDAEFLGKDNSLTATGGICSFRIKDATSLPELAGVLSIRYETGTAPVSVVLGAATATSKAFGDVLPLAGCDPYILKPGITTRFPGFQKKEIPDAFAKDIKCEGDAKLYAGPPMSPQLVTSGIVCDKTNQPQWKINGATDFDAKAGFIFCAVPIGKTCKDLARDPSEPDQLRVPGFDTEGSMTLKCKPGNWKIEGNFYFMEPLFCKESGKTPNEGGWFARKKGGEEVEVKSAVCTAKVDCEIHAPPWETDNAGNHVKPYVKTDPNDPNAEKFIACGVKNSYLEVSQNGSLIAHKPSTIKCDFTKGVYRLDKPDVELLPGAKVYCIVDAAAAESDEQVAAAGSNMTKEWLMVLAPLLFGFLAIGAIVAHHKFEKRKIDKAFDDLAKKRLGGNMSGRALKGFNKSMASDRSEKSSTSLSPQSEGGASARELPGELKLAPNQAPLAPPFTPWEWKFDETAWKSLEVYQKRLWIRWMIRRNGGKKEFDAKKEINKSGRSMKEFKTQLRRVDMALFMDVLNFFFKGGETNPLVWRELLPYVFFLERDFFHCSQTKDSTVEEIKKNIPGYCYERYRLYLLHMADTWLKEHGTKPKDAKEDPAAGFIRSVCFILKYKLNLANPKAANPTEQDKKDEEAIEKGREEIVNTVNDLFFDGGKMNMTDASRMAVWGILRHEDNASTRFPGEHERFGVENECTLMLDHLHKEFNELLKQSLEPRPPEGSKMQHVLFAMGCSLEREAMFRVWEIMKEDQRFIAEDYMFVMYGRDWVWDGAWAVWCQRPPEHLPFVMRFTQECKEYKELAEIITRYHADHHSKDGKEGYCFEGLMREYNKNFDADFLPKFYRRHSLYLKEDRYAMGKVMNQWLLENDPREIAGYTATGKALVEKAQAKPETADGKEEKELANAHVPKEVTATAGSQPQPSS